jgi:hypothetical protein
MAYYAFLDENNVVTEVITGIDETELIESLNPEVWYGNFRGQTCKRTSYNTINNTHSNGGTPFRGNFASVGATFDSSWGADGGFVPVKRYASWVFDETICSWKAPVPYPTDDRVYDWDESTQGWTLAP